MGKAAMIMVVGTAVILGILGRAMLTRSNDSSKGASSYYTSTAASNIAAAGLEIYLQKLRANPSLASGTYTDTLFNGNFSVTLATGTPSSKRILTSVGTIMGDRDTIRAYCDSASASSFAVNAALMYSKGATGGTMMINDAFIDGRNYNYTTGALDASSPSVRGLTKENNAVSNTFNNGGIRGSGGGPIPRDSVSLGSAQLDMTSAINQMYASRTRLISASTTYASVTWGTTAVPEITVITNTVIVNTACSGVGVLIIAGPFTTNGTFNWKGLVIVTSKDASWPGATGAFTAINNGGTIYGALIRAGSNASYTLNGGGANTILYSKSIIDLVSAAFGLGGGGGTGRTKYAVSKWYD